MTGVLYTVMSIQYTVHLVLDLCLTLSHKSPYFTCLQYMSVENTVGKGEIARNEQFLLFPQCFLSFLENFLPVVSNLKLSSANSFSFEGSTKICRLGED